MDLAIVITVVVVALAFDYTNGFHDAANAIATSVSTRALTPRVALILAAVMNFVGAFLGQKVAHTVSDVIVPPTGREGLVVVLAGLLGAIIWNLTTWYFGLPSSSSHALIGGLVGAAIGAGTTVHWSTIFDKVVIPMVVSPLVGFAVAFVVMLAILWLFRHRNAGNVNFSLVFFHGDDQRVDFSVVQDRINFGAHFFRTRGPGRQMNAAHVPRFLRHGHRCGGYRHGGRVFGRSGFRAAEFVSHKNGNQCGAEKQNFNSG